MSTTTARTRSGLVTFAGVLLLLAAAINLTQGVVALAADSHYDEGELLVGGLTAWGIWWLALGALLVFGAVGIFTRAASGAIIAFTLAGLNAFTQFVTIGAYPVWSIIAIAVDMLIIYAVTTHLGEFEESA